MTTAEAQAKQAGAKQAAPTPAPVKALAGASPDALPQELASARQPILLPGLVKGWPATAACASVPAATAYLKQFWQAERRLSVFVGDKSIDGRFFYAEDFQGFNFKSGLATLPQVMHKLAQKDRPDKEATIYVGSTPVDDHLPGFRAQNDLALTPLSKGETPLISFWLGNATRVSAHFDFPDNIACAVAGRRRVTLFPPEQLPNLYIGPLHATPAGQPISLVDFKRPDFNAHPRFRQALQAAQTCTLEPGDALFIPSMWWHHIEALDGFNLLVNYWWCSSPVYMGAPLTALLHGILSLRDLKPEVRQVWRQIFDHYVFAADESTAGHIPEPGRAWLAPLDETLARQLRADLLNRLNR